MELAWRNGMTDFAMPFMIQYMRHLHDKVKVLEERTAPPKNEEAESEQAAFNAAMYGGMMTNDTLMIGNGYTGGYTAPGSIPDPYAQPQQGYGQGGYGGGY